MQYETVESYSQTKPLEVDKVSSRTTVYLRRNIRKVANEEGSGTHWKMEEARISREEYAAMESAVYEDLVERLTLQDVTQAEILLGQAQIQEDQMGQDETLANILLNQMEGIGYEQTV